MSETISNMTPQEFQQLVEEAVEQKLTELLCDPDQGAAVREDIEDRLLHQRWRVAAGDRGESKPIAN
jgi:hypothetical protein